MHRIRLITKYIWVFALTVVLILPACAAPTQVPTQAVEPPPAANTQAPAQPAQPTQPPAAQPTTPPAAAPGDNVLTIVRSSSVATLDPIKSVAAGDIEILGQLFSRLLRRSPDGSELLPGLAEKWEVSPDNKVYTFHLRDAKFSDGSPITADDVVFSYLRLRDQEDSAYGGTFQVIEDIVALDNKTVEITLDSPAGTFPAAVEMFNAGIVSKAAVEKMGDEEFGKNPVSSGPFMVKEWRPGDRLILQRNPNYWREGLPHLDGVEFVEVQNDSTRVSMLLTGEAEVASGNPWVRIEELKKNPDVVVPLDPSTVITIVLINHKVELLQDVRVRKALAMGLDVPSIIQGVTFGNATPANSLIPNTLDYYNPDLPAIPYDPDEAKRLVEEAGVKGAEFEIMAQAGESSSVQFAQLMQDQWMQIGLAPYITEVDFGTWWDKVVTYDYGVAATWWYNETPDPDLAVRWALCGSCGNDSFYSSYNNDRINELTELGLREPDPEKRKAIYHEIQQISLDEVAQIPLSYSPYSYAYRKEVKDLIMNPSFQWSLDIAKIER